MTDYILLMHDDVTGDVEPSAWGPYLEELRSTSGFQGGSAIGSGICMRREGVVPSVTNHIIGFIKLEARDLDQVRRLLKGNPVYEAGGTIEIRELPRTG